MSLRVAVLGSSRFGAHILNAVAERYDVVMSSGPTFGEGKYAHRADLLHSAANRHGIPWVPDHLWTAGCMPSHVDVLVAAHYTRVIGPRTLAATTLGGLGLHPSLLPRHRGRDAVRWTIHMGDPIAGFSAYWLDGRIDGGDIAAQDWLFVRPGWNHRDLWDALQPVGRSVILRALEDLEGGRVYRHPQDPKVATWEPSWDRPPLDRPELPELGRMPNGYHVIRESVR